MVKRYLKSEQTDKQTDRRMDKSTYKSIGSEADALKILHKGDTKNLGVCE